ncbi:XRN1, partial [Symbiodinium pilosum]
MAYDLAHYDKLPQPGIELEVGKPFRPFQQLMAVLPSSSKSLLPACFQWLFDSKDSPILNFYPQKFVVDMDGVKVPWGGMTLIPFIDPMSLLTAMDASDQLSLSKAEERRNEFRSACTLRYDMKAQYSLPSTWPGKYPDLAKCPV